MNRCWIVLIGWLWFAAAAADERGTGETAPLAVRNLSPATFLFGLPRPLGAEGGSGVSVIVEHSNNFSARVSGDDAAVFDGSTSVVSVALGAAIGERWEWGLEIPWVHHDGGFTDGFVDGFHDLFGLPGGNRAAVPDDRLFYRVVYEGREVVLLTDSAGHVGDVRARLGFRLHSGPGRSTVARAMVELPTGRARDLSGSGGTDAAVWLELTDRRWLEAIGTTVSLMAGVTAPGDNDLLPGQSRDAVAFGHVGLHYPLTPRVTLKAQLDGHGDVLDSGPVPLAGGALLGTLGGSLALSPSLRVDLGVVEDLTTHRAPDVVFFLGLWARLP